MTKGKTGCWVCEGEGWVDIGDAPEDHLECGCVDMTEEEFQASDHRMPEGLADGGGQGIAS